MDKIIEQIVKKELPLSDEDLQKTTDFCWEQIEKKNLHVLGKLPEVLYRDWTDLNLPLEVRADGHSHVKPEEWRATLEEQCHLTLTAYFKNNSYGLNKNTVALLVWRASLAFLPALVYYQVKICHMEMKRTPELKITIPLPLKREGEIILGKCDRVFIPDPMVAAGTSCAGAIDILHSLGVVNDRIIVLCICAAPEGIYRLLNCYPGIQIITDSLSRNLNEDAYIVGPGLGDAGDKYFCGNSIGNFEKYRQIFNDEQWNRLEYLLEAANK